MDINRYRLLFDSPVCQNTCFLTTTIMIEFLRYFFLNKTMVFVTFDTLIIDVFNISCTHCGRISVDICGLGQQNDLYISMVCRNIYNAEILNKLSFYVSNNRFLFNHSNIKISRTGDRLSRRTHCDVQNTFWSMIYQGGLTDDVYNS